MQNDQPLAYQELDLATELLRNAPLSPELSAAVYQALGRLTGSEALGSRTDFLGRSGEAIGATDASGLRLELIIDPTTGRGGPTVAALGAGGISGVLTGEGISSLRRVSDTTSPPYWWGEFALGVLLLATVVARRPDKARTAAITSSPARRRGRSHRGLRLPLLETQQLRSLFGDRCAHLTQPAHV